ncbi:MAG: glutamate racemase [Armatimonadota bacterium]
MIEPSAPVGVFDSGLGGLTVVRQIRRILPQESILYLADTAHVPYGSRPAEEVRQFALTIMQFLVNQGAKAVVAACNMSSALAVDEARESLGVPVLGVLESGAQAAVSIWTEGPLGVIATEGTVATGAYPKAIARINPKIEVIQSACPEFVPLVEAGLEDSPQAESAARRYLAPLINAGCRTIILGCTHYPLLLPVLQKAAPNVTFVDPAEGTVRQLLCTLSSLNMRSSGRPIHRFLATAEPHRLSAGLKRFAGICQEAEFCNLWENKPSQSMLEKWPL